MWQTIDPTDITNLGFSPGEASAIALIQGSTTVISRILVDVVNSARGYIISGGNQLDAPDTIPDMIRGHVLAIARWEICLAFPQLKALQTDGRQKAWERAMDTLEKISKKELKVELPAVATTQQLSGPISQIEKTDYVNPRQTRRNDLSHL